MKKDLNRILQFFWTILLFFLSTNELLAQSGLIKEYEQLRYLRLGSQNDLYQIKNQTDKYFSVGTTIDFRHPVLNNVVSRNALIGIRNTKVNEYGVEFRQLGYTPTDISLPAIDPTDRPYAGLLYANFYRISSDLTRGLRFRSSVKIGVIGSASLMSQTQKYVHRLTGDAQPIGWETQIGNSLLLDYTFKVTKTLPLNIPFLEVNMAAEAEIGSVFNLVGVGAEIKIGRVGNFNLNYNSQDLTKVEYSNRKRSRDFQFYAFIQPRVSYVLYDGTVSGGLISFQENQHVLPRSAAESSLFFMSHGFTMRFKKVMVRYKRILRSDRFIEGDGFFKGDQFSWGEIDLVLLF